VPGLSDPDIADMFQIASNINSSRNGESGGLNAGVMNDFTKFGTIRNKKDCEYFEDENSQSLSNEYEGRDIYETVGAKKK
jgi:hypothetical protein